MIDPALIQTLADRLAGQPTNGRTAADFPEPLATLWRELDGSANSTWPQTVTTWAGNDSDRLDLLDAIFQRAPGAPLPPDPWQIKTLADAYAVRPPLQFLVAETITAPSLVVVYGAPGCLKSMLVADLAVCVASGTNWLEPSDCKAPDARATIRTPVLWCDFDNGERRTSERFEALARARQLPASTPLHYVSLPNPWLVASDPNSMADLYTRVKRLGVQLVIIDNLGTVCGDADENSADMIPVMASFRQLAEMTGACVILIHHQRKSYGTNGRSGDSLRGHSSIEAALDLGLLVMREEFSDTLLVKSTKTRDVDVAPFGAVWEYTHKPGTKELHTAIFKGSEVPGVPNSDTAIRTAILDAVGASPYGPLSQSQIVATVKRVVPSAGQNKIRKLTDALASEGLLFVTPGPRGSMMYAPIGSQSQNIP
jgi:hypothetical protein